MLFLDTLADEDILQALGDGNNSDIEFFDDDDDVEGFFIPSAFDNLGDLHLPEDPVENQGDDQIEGSPAPEQPAPAPSSEVATVERPSRFGSRPRPWRVSYPKNSLLNR